MTETIQSFIPDLQAFAINLIAAILIYVVGRRVITILCRMADRFLERKNVDAGVRGFVKETLKIVLNLFLILAVIAQLGFSTASIVTILGAAGLAIVMSLQGSLANVAGGILILITKQFRVDDFISTAYGDGKVTEIGLVYTKVTTPDNRVLTIPNGELSNSAVTDATVNDMRRLDMEIGISYESDLTRGKELIAEIFQDCPGRVEEKEIDVHVSRLADSAVMLEFFGYVETQKYLAAKWYMAENIKLRFDEEGIVIAYPQMDVHLQRDTNMLDHLKKV